LFHPGTVTIPVTDHSFKELHMKRIIVALVLALSIVSLTSIVGCGGSQTTSTKTK
jgi:hypothetical protein